MSDIPGARAMVEQLRGLLPTAEAYRINLILEKLHRRAYVRRAPVRSERVYAEKAEAIRRFCEVHPHASLDWVGRKFKCDGGRVSEALDGLLVLLRADRAGGRWRGEPRRLSLVRFERPSDRR